MMKEYGSWEDEGQHEDHVVSVLKKITKKGGQIEMTEKQAKAVIQSGRYTISSYNDNELEGGSKTKEAIKKFINKIDEALKKS